MSKESQDANHNPFDGIAAPDDHHDVYKA